MKTESENRVSYADLYFHDLKIFMDKKIDFSFLNKIPAGGEVELQKNEIASFLKKAVRNDDFRKANESTYEFLRKEHLRFFLDAIFAERGYVYENLMKDNKFGFEANEFRGYFTVAMLLRDFFYIKSTRNRLYIYNAYHFTKTRFEEEFSSYMRKAQDLLKAEIPSMSDLLLAVVLKSGYPYREEDMGVSVSSRLIAVLDRVAKMSSNFCMQTDTNSLGEYGSLFKVLSANASFLGLSPKIIEEISQYGRILTPSNR